MGTGGLGLALNAGPTASHAIKWEQSSARIVALLHRADECPGGGWVPAELGPHLAGQTVRVETTSGAIEGPARAWAGGTAAWRRAPADTPDAST